MNTNKKSIKQEVIRIMLGKSMTAREVSQELPDCDIGRVWDAICALKVSSSCVMDVIVNKNQPSIYSLKRVNANFYFRSFNQSLQGQEGRQRKHPKWEAEEYDAVYFMTEFNRLISKVRNLRYNHQITHK